jgi:hypothetical protein
MNLQCSVCGGKAPGAQWWNQDQGFGICAGCFESERERNGFAEAERTYGRPGLHHIPFTGGEGDL